MFPDRESWYVFRFLNGCADEPKTLLICGELDEKRKKGIKIFLRAAKVEFQSTVHVDSLSDVTEDKTWKVYVSEEHKLPSSDYRFCFSLY